MLAPGQAYFGADYSTVGDDNTVFSPFDSWLSMGTLCPLFAAFLVAGILGTLILSLILSTTNALGIPTSTGDAVMVILIMVLLLAMFCVIKLNSDDDEYSPLSSFASSYSYAKPKSTPGKPIAAGATGLHNLGNTCYMNSTLQCLNQIPQLTNFFLSNQYQQHINDQNVLGTQGRMAEAYALLLNSLWSGEYVAVAPEEFKRALGELAAIFKGYEQHDSQELLGCVLDKLHEDLNLGVRTQGGGQGGEAYRSAMEEVSRLEAQSFVPAVHLEAAKAWLSHVERNESVISRLFQGQLLSRLSCTNADCGHEATSFDTFMYLALPLPPEYHDYKIELVTGSGGLLKARRYTFRLLKAANVQHLKTALRQAGLVPQGTNMRVTVVYSGRGRKLDNTASLYPMSRSRVVVYLRPAGAVALLPIMHRRITRVPRYQTYGYEESESDDVVVARPCGVPYLMPVFETTTCEEVVGAALKWAMSCRPEAVNGLDVEPRLSCCDAYGNSCFVRHPNCRGCELARSSEQFAVTTVTESGSEAFALPFPTVCIDWGTTSQDPDGAETPELGEAVHLEPIIQDGKLEEEKDDPSATASTRITLAQCLDNFYKPELLGKANKWTCPECKKAVSAKKSMGIWRLPDVLVIVLKRFNYQERGNHGLSSKVDSLVEFPITGLDLHRWVAQTDGKTAMYDLFAVSNHTGSLMGGHYTAHVKSAVSGVWHSFNDKHVSVVTGSAETQTVPALQQALHTRSVYVLMYRRQSATELPTIASPSRSKLTAAQSDSSEDSEVDSPVARATSPSMGDASEKHLRRR